MSVKTHSDAGDGESGMNVLARRVLATVLREAGERPDGPITPESLDTVAESILEDAVIECRDDTARRADVFVAADLSEWRDVRNRISLGVVDFDIINMFGTQATDEGKVIVEFLGVHRGSTYEKNDEMGGVDAVGGTTYMFSISMPFPT